MKLKKPGKRLLYFVGGIVIVFISSIILAVSFHNGGRWYDQSAFYLYVAILFGLGLFIVSLIPKLDEPSNPKKIPREKTNDLRAVK